MPVCGTTWRWRWRRRRRRPLEARALSVGAYTALSVETLASYTTLSVETLAPITSVLRNGSAKSDYPPCQARQICKWRRQWTKHTAAVAMAPPPSARAPVRTRRGDNDARWQHDEAMARSPKKMPAHSRNQARRGDAARGRCVEAVAVAPMPPKRARGNTRRDDAARRRRVVAVAIAPKPPARARDRAQRDDAARGRRVEAVAVCAEATGVCA